MVDQFYPPTYRILVSVLRRNQWGKGRFCFLALPSLTLVMKDFWEGYQIVHVNTSSIIDIIIFIHASIYMFAISMVAVDLLYCLKITISTSNVCENRKDSIQASFGSLPYTLWKSCYSDFRSHTIASTGYPIIMSGAAPELVCNIWGSHSGTETCQMCPVFV